MLPFPSGINQRVTEEIGFEYGPRLKEYISTFKVLNSILELKPVIAKYISIWVSIPYDVKFNYLRHSVSVRALRDCTDSFFILTNNEPLEPNFRLHLNGAFRRDPLIFDVHNYLGKKLNNGLNHGIRKFDVLVENLIFLSDKRPKRILELVLPSSDFEGNRFAEGLLIDIMVTFPRVYTLYAINILNSSLVQKRWTHSQVCQLENNITSPLITKRGNDVRLL